MEIAIITREREHNLLHCVSCILGNTILPDSIIIVKSIPFKDIQILKKIRRLLLSKKVKLKYRQVPDEGISYSRNIALSMINSDLYSFIDDDEYCYPNWISSAQKLLIKHPNAVAVTGYKEIYYEKNYWNMVWEALCKQGEKEEGYTDFATSSNTFYRTHFIKNYRLKYDNKFRSSSEDLVLSQKIKMLKKKIWYSYKLKVKHKFRTSMLDMVRQWFDYGKTLKLFKKEYLSFCSSTSKLSIDRFLFQGIKSKDKSLYLIPGLVIIDLSMFVGYLYCGFLIVSNKLTRKTSRELA